MPIEFTVDSMLTDPGESTLGIRQILPNWTSQGQWFGGTPLAFTKLATTSTTEAEGGYTHNQDVASHLFW